MPHRNIAALVPCVLLAVKPIPFRANLLLKAPLIRTVLRIFT